MSVIQETIDSANMCFKIIFSFIRTGYFTQLVFTGKLVVIELQWLVIDGSCRSAKQPAFSVSNSELAVIPERKVAASEWFRSP